MSSNNNKFIVLNSAEPFDMHEAQNGGNADYVFNNTHLNDELCG